MNATTLEIAMAKFLDGDLVAAEAMLLELAEAGDGHAAHNLGTLYATGGPGVGLDGTKSRFWFERALASGFEATVSADPEWFRRRV